MKGSYFSNFPEDKVLFVRGSKDDEDQEDVVTVKEMEKYMGLSMPPYQEIMFPIMNTSAFGLAGFFSLLNYSNPILLCSEYHLSLAHEILETTDITKLKGKPLIGFFTSATTGAPRAVFHDIPEFLSRYPKGNKPIQSICFYKADHIAFIDVLLSTIASGGVMVLQEHYNPGQAIDDIEKNDVTHLFCSPSFLNLLCKSETDWNRLSSLEMICYGSELMPGHLKALLTSNLPGVKFRNVYATTQALRRHTIYDPLDPDFFRLGVADIDYQIVDGELKLRKPSSLRYVIKNFEVHEAGEWINTGDIVEVNERGYYRIIGRNADYINVGGEKVLPGRIEEILKQLDEVADIKIYGEQNELLGEMVCADVVKGRNSDEGSVKDAIRALARQELRPEEMPVKITFVETIKLSERLKR
jgi:acyl-coenzyme A synthetase/AMP-(fatty) acid ligase